jgi:hypothetical protein
MKPIKTQDERLIRAYSRALHLYPAGFRKRNAEAMLRTFRDAVEDGDLVRLDLVALTVTDLCSSLIREHITMLRDTFARPVLVYNALVLAALSTGLALALYAIPLNILRSGANDPQIQMATDTAVDLSHLDLRDPVQKGGLVPFGAAVDMAQSLRPFLIIYDDQGQVIASGAQLDGRTPTLSKGVLDYVRTHGEDRISWEPIAHSHAVRIAAVVERVNGPQPGFVLAGRSMREVEARIAQVSQMAQLTWFGMLGVIALGTAVLGWYTRPRAV